MTLGKLLVAYDFSASAERALQYAIHLCCGHSTEIIVAYVEPPSQFVTEMEGGFASVHAARLQAHGEITSVAERVRRFGIRSSAVCRVGAPTDSLVQLAAESKADLFVMGASSREHKNPEHLGSTAEFLLRCLPCASVVIGPHATVLDRSNSLSRHIVYASSIPNKLSRAARFAEMFARRWEAQVEIVHVIDDRSLTYDCRLNAEIDSKGMALAEKFREMGIEARWHLWVGSPADKIVDLARELAAELVVFGVEHHATNAAVFGVLSSTIQRVACPVLNVPGPA